MKAFHDHPDQYARPYEWTLSDIAIAEGPTLNYAELEHAQDILKYCARQRTTLLDQLNLLTWMVSHPERFDWTNAASPEKIREASNATQVDLDTLADCASRAINDPANALMPAPYAAARGGSYPSAVVPSPLPKPHPGETGEPRVRVPRVIGLSEADGKQKVRYAGLNPVCYIETRPGGHNDWNIHGQEPDPDTLVEPGSNVVLIWDVDSPEYGGYRGCPSGHNT
ncbi:hypothetical protein NNL21_35590 [Paenibacillus mendelii]|nr:hypothetical protein [Paenibacillus mendelii]